MADTLATISAAVMRPLIGGTFIVTLPSGRTASAVLASVDERPAHADSGTQRVPFSFILNVPGDRTDAQQGIIRLAHEAIGVLEPFAVPVGLDGDAVHWQVVFS